MDIDLTAFHFLRPLWLLLVALGVLLPLLWWRNQDTMRQLRASIAEHLLKHLLVTPQHKQRVQPIHLASALLVIGGLAAAGPTWEQDVPPFLENRAPLILALDLSPSMDATDVPPSRLQAAKHKLHDLITRRAGARTGLIAYAGSAHLVLPPTDDPQLLNGFLEALSTSLIERPGKDALGVIQEAKRVLAIEQVPGTVLLVTDGADTTQLNELKQQLADSQLQLLVLAVGNKDGGLIKTADGLPLSDANGRPQLARFDPDALRKLADATDAPLGSLTLDNDDLDWVELHAQQHFQAASNDQTEVHWKDAGYWLSWPLLLIAFFCIRRGWSLNWSAAVLLALGFTLQPTPAQAGVFADAFLTADQQGRWAFEHGHYPQAAEHFHDPYWKGVAAYHAVDYDLALATFAQLDTAPAYFYLGNIYTRRFKFDQAIAAYQQALKLQPQFPEATANLALAIALQKDHQSAAEQAPDLPPDEIKFDKQKNAGTTKQTQTPQAASDDLWLQNLSTSPAQFLKQKFNLQNAARQKPTGEQP